MRRSIIKQSYDARERNVDANLPSHLQLGNLNGDGCVHTVHASSAHRSRSMHSHTHLQSSTPAPPPLHARAWCTCRC
jgi:hypothetical protein